MKRRATYHTHTTWCDGRSSAEDMILSALEAGFTDIGFSAHAAWSFSSEWHLDITAYEGYAGEIRRLAEQYRTRITVRLGFESDYIPGITAPDRSLYERWNPDFIIGSVHYVPAPAESGSFVPWCVDAPTAEVRRGLEACFGGDGKRAIQAYFAQVRKMAETCDFDIIGHLDLPKKRNGELRFFDETADWYREEIAKTAASIAASGKIVELNTGGIARGVVETVYPSKDICRALSRYNIPMTVNSDAHRSQDIAYAYPLAYEYAKEAGCTELMYLDDSGWTGYPLE